MFNKLLRMMIMWHEGVRELKGGKSFYKNTIYLMGSIHIFFKGMKFHRKPKEKKYIFHFYMMMPKLMMTVTPNIKRNFTDDILNAANEI